MRTTQYNVQQDNSRTISLSFGSLFKIEQKWLLVIFSGIFLCLLAMPSLSQESEQKDGFVELETSDIDAVYPILPDVLHLGFADASAATIETTLYNLMNEVCQDSVEERTETMYDIDCTALGPQRDQQITEANLNLVKNLFVIRAEAVVAEAWNETLRLQIETERLVAERNRLKVENGQLVTTEEYNALEEAMLDLEVNFEILRIALEQQCAELDGSNGSELDEACAVVLGEGGI